MDVRLPPSINTFDGYMLMKFTKSEKYRQEFLDGILYFNPSDYFARCDDKGRGDSDEGMSFIINPERPESIAANLEKVEDTYMIVVRDYSNNPTEYVKGTIWNYSSAQNRKRKLLSLYTVYIDTINKRVSSFSDKMRSEFGKYGILILNRQEFFRRVIKALDMNGHFYNKCMGFVEYLPDEELKGIVDWHPFVWDLSNTFQMKS